MKSTSVTENLTQITRFGFVNSFLVREADGLTLVDTGLPRGASGILAAADSVGAPIVRVAITHGHGDHVGSLDELRGGLGPGVPVLMPELDAQLLFGETRVEGKLTGTWPKIATRPDTRLHPGDRVGSLEVVPAPGHSPGQVAFLDTRDRTIIAGDAFSSLGGLAVTDHVHPRFPLPGYVTYDRAQASASARTIRALEPSVLVVGHGPPVRDATAAIDAVLVPR